MIRIDSITTCPLISTDKDFPYQVYTSTRLDELSVLPWTDEQKAAFMQMQFNIREQQYRAMYPEALPEVILCNNVPAGTMITSQTEETISLVDIALLPQFRGVGIGGRILRELQKQGKKIILHVSKDNPAIHLYSRLGFVTVVEDAMYIGMEWSPQ